MIAKKTQGRKLRFDRLEDRRLLSISFPVDHSMVAVDSGTLSVASLTVGTLTIGSPNSGTDGGSTNGVIGSSPVMDGGRVRYSSDALPGLIGINGADLVCTDPPDLANSWRSTSTVKGGGSITFPPPEISSDVKVRNLGDLTVYDNRYGQPVAAEQSYVDTAWDGTIAAHTEHLACKYLDGKPTTIYANGSVDSVVEKPNELAVGLSGQGTIINQQFAGFGSQNRLSGQQVTMNGAEQLSMTDDGYATTYTVGSETFSLPDGLGLGQILSDIQPMLVAVATPKPDFKVAHGTDVFAQIGSLIGGRCPSGDYSQPPAAGSGFETSTATSHTVTVMLFGLPPGEYSCNTLQNSPINSAAGTMQGFVINGAPNTAYNVNYVVSITTIVTAADPSNPGLGGTPCGNVNVQVSDTTGWTSNAGGVGCSSANPIPNGSVLKSTVGGVGSIYDRTITVTTNAQGEAFVAQVSPSIMANRGCGLVVYTATMSIPTITLVPPPPPPPPKAAAEELFVKTATNSFHVIDESQHFNPHRHFKFTHTHDHYFAEIGSHFGEEV